MCTHHKYACSHAHTRSIICNWFEYVVTLSTEENRHDSTDIEAEAEEVDDDKNDNSRREEEKKHVQNIKLFKMLLESNPFN